MIPEVLKPEPFEVMRERFINDSFYPLVKTKLGQKLADAMVRALRSPNETAAMLLDAMILFRQQEVRNDNFKALQQFSETVSDPQMIDLIVSRFGLKRQELIPADLSVFPIVPAVMESDESLLLRYALAPYGLSTTGTRTGYKFHSLTLGERPLISVEAESENVVVMRYEFTPTVGVKRPKDSAARMTEPNSGKVEIRILSFDGDGTASDALQAAVFDYIQRHDIAQETDEVTVKSAEIRPYDIEVIVKEISKPNQLVDQPALDKALGDYTKRQHKLNGEIKRTRLIQIAHNHNADDMEILKPVKDVICDWYQAPYCTGIKTSVRPKES